MRKRGPRGEEDVTTARSRAYVGLGANLGDRRATLERAVALLGEHSEVRVVARSALHETEPWGPVAQPPFLNGVVALDTSLSPRELLDLLLGVEQELGRVRTERWGPRTVDLDLLLYGEETVAEPGLVVPHPRLHERAFTLEPLAELDPDLVVPGHGPVTELVAALRSGGSG